MKKILSLVFAVFTVATIFAAARPSVDGRAVVCEEGEMPKGLFAKTIGYLPGDSVTVTNPANGTTVDVLVLGSIDSGEGVAILLSSEAAEKLLIKKDSNVQVKITRRTGSIDESVSGTAVLTEEGEENVSEPETEQNIAESEKSQDSVEFEEAETPVEENKISESDSEITECETPVEDTETVEPVEENSGSKAESEVLEEKPEDIENENSEVFDADSFDEESEAPADEQKGDLSESVETEELSETEDTNTENSPEPSEEDNSEKIDAPAPEAQKEPDGEIVEEKKPENLETEEDSASPESFSEDIENAETETSDDITEDKEQSEHFESEALSKVDDTEIAEEYAPIVLTPSALNPPETENENIEEESRDEPLKEVFVPEQADEKVESSAAEENAEISGFESFVTTDAELKKGMYYLQIATLSNEENVANLTEKYGKKYPLALIKQENKNAYRVLVGPLNADEFGMIKERFESYGFKDAFLRKIK